MPFRRPSPQFSEAATVIMTPFIRRKPRHRGLSDLHSVAQSGPKPGSQSDSRENAHVYAAHRPLETHIQPNCELLEARRSVSTSMQSGTLPGEGLLSARHFHIQFLISLTSPASHMVLIPSLYLPRGPSLRDRRGGVTGTPLLCFSAAFASKLRA